MNLQKLVDLVGNSVEFSPQQNRGYIESRIANITRWRSNSGKLYTYRWFTDKWHYEIPIFTRSKTDADQLNTWRKNNTELTFYPDLSPDTASITRTVHITNDSDPMILIDPQWKVNFQGMVYLEEI